MLGQIYDKIKGTKKSKLAHFFEKNNLDEKTEDIVTTITDLKCVQGGRGSRRCMCVLIHYRFFSS